MPTMSADDFDRFAEALDRPVPHPDDLTNLLDSPTVFDDDVQPDPRLVELFARPKRITRDED